MISFLKRDVEIVELLFRDDFTSDKLEDNWEITGGEWKTRDGVLTGLFRGNSGGLIYSRQSFPGDIMLDFYGTMLPPCDNDLNFTFRADGWDYQANDASIGYIGGLNGWWLRHTGLERYPGCALRSICDFRAEAGKEYHIQTGIVGSDLFLAVDGRLIMMLSDPNPITDANCMRVGLGTYCSHIAFRDFKVYRAVAKNVKRAYTPVF